MVSNRSSRARVVISSSDDEAEFGGKAPDPENAANSSRPVQGHGKLKSISAKTKGSSRTPNAPSRASQVDKQPKKESTSARSTNKSIHSFFSAVPENQRTKSLALKVEATPHNLEELDTIKDDSLDEDQSLEPPDAALSKGSTIALAVRKRKLQPTQNFDDDNAQLSSGSQKFRRVGTSEKIRPKQSVGDSDVPWTVRFAPTSLSELAVHHQKVSDVRKWLVNALQGNRRKLLVLKGAAGSGKTSTVTLLANELKMELLEWSDARASDALSERPNSTLRFEEFVGRLGQSHGTLTLTDTRTESRMAQILPLPHTDSETQRSRALLVEEFPDTFVRNSNSLQSFRATVAQYLSTRPLTGDVPTPIVMIISETLISTSTSAADSFTAHRLLGPELLASPNVNVIEFNPIAPTFMVKALETIVLKEARVSGRRTTPGPQVLRELAEVGDIRSAVSALEFLCVREDSWSSKIAFTKTKQSKNQKPLTTAEKEVLGLIGNRERSLGIFHTVGKVVYNKRTTQINDESTTGNEAIQLSQYRHSLFPETDANRLMYELGSDVRTFVAALHENYALSCSSPTTEKSLSSLSDCMECLSDSDLISPTNMSFADRTYSSSSVDSLRQDEICFQLAVRGLLYNLPYPVHRSLKTNRSQADSHRMFYPYSLKLWKHQGEVEDNVELIAHSLRRHMDADIFGTGPSTNIQGVKGWHTTQMNAKESLAGSSAEDAPLRIQPEGKADLVQDRIPYLARLAASPTLPHLRISQVLHRSLIFATTFTGNTLTSNDDDEIDQDLDLLPSGSNWTKGKGANQKGEGRQDGLPQSSNDQGATIVKDVDSLVLEDDDIVDD